MPALMQEGDEVRHIFLRSHYIVERLTAKKAEVRHIQAGGTLSDSTVMVLRRNLVVVKQEK